jgi:hypothetical protein
MSTERSEYGATAVLVAGSLLLIMGVAAISIDWSSATNQRRQDQTAADLGSIAAVQFASGSTKANAVATGAQAAMDIVEQTLSLGSLDWSSCDPNPITGVGAISYNSCISYTNNLRKARVIIPPIDVAAPFGSVLGLGSISTSAESTAGAETNIGGNVLPFGLPGGSAGDAEICLRTVNSANGTGPCTENQDGNFGTLDISQFGDEAFGTKKECTGFAQDRLEVNMALGADHPLGIHSDFAAGAPPGDIVDTDRCTSNNNFLARPNIVAGETGQGSALYPGMVGGTNKAQLLLNPPVPGRLARGPASSRLSVDSSSPTINNEGLWTFIRSDSSTANLPASCQGSITSHADMVTCIVDWRAAPGTYDSLFAEQDDASSPYIGEAVRFAAVPVLGGPTQEWDSGKKEYKISDIVPIYVSGTYWDCNANGCTITHYPGESSGAACGDWDVVTCGVGSNGKGKLTALTGYILDKGMLPSSLSNSWPDTKTGIAINLVS